MADIIEVKRALARQAQQVAEYLLPSGHKEGSEWRIGSVRGEPGQSLGVHLVGAKAGVWSDFSAGQSGDLLDLWMASKGFTLPQALDEARKWLGMERPEAYREPKKVYKRPPKPSCVVPQGVVLDYLTEDRKIPLDILQRYKVAAQVDEIVFPFLLPGGELALAKTRKVGPGERPIPTAADCEPILFGWQAIPDDAREVVITEGEIDALSMAAYGFPAMSVPFGGGKGAKQQWIENEFERLERFEKIYLALDMDKEGELAATEIAGRLGRHRCVRVKLPRKDANACLVDGVTHDEIRDCMSNAQSLDPEGLRRAKEFRDKVVELFWPTGGSPPGYVLPYGKLADRLRFRPSELTLWSGESGAGKSQLLSDGVVDWIKQGSRVCVCSVEMKGEQTLRRMCKQVVGVDRPTEQAVDEALDWLDPGLLIYDRLGKASLEGLLEVFDYARAKYGCDQFVIDSLMRLGISSDDYGGQEKAVFRLVQWTIEQGVHLHLVAHARKGERDRGGPAATEDIKGASEIGANAFNIITVWRDRKREDQIRAAATEEEKAELMQRPTVIANVAKQRNGDWEGKQSLWFDEKTYRYFATSDRANWRRYYLRAPLKDAA